MFINLKYNIRRRGVTQQKLPNPNRNLIRLGKSYCLFMHRVIVTFFYLLIYHHHHHHHRRHHIFHALYC